MGLFHAGRKSVLLVWPTGAELKAYRGRCPHADMPLSEATFDGKTVICPHHQWGFDSASGKCVTHLVRNALHPYACASRATRFKSTSDRSNRRGRRRDAAGLTRRAAVLPSIIARIALFRDAQTSGRTRALAQNQRRAAAAGMKVRGMTDQKEEWVIWNGSLGTLDMATIGRVEDGAGWQERLSGGAL